MAQLREAGAHVTLSSDSNADLLSPFGTMQRILTRDENAIDSVAQAIELVTIGASCALSQETTTGSIEAGTYAGFVIVDQDLLEIDVDDIDDTKVLLTVVGGIAVHQTSGFGHAHLPGARSLHAVHHPVRSD